MTVAAPDILALTRDARLAPLAMHAIPAWLWAADGARVLWANATGAAALAALNVAALRERTFTTDEPLGADIARLVATLPPTSAKYERLRDVGTSLVCACSRVEVAGVAGILVTASEPGRTLPLAERASRLFGASSEALAAFTPDGALLYTNANLEGGTTLAALGVKTENALKKFLDPAQKFKNEPEEEGVLMINGVLIETSEHGKATSIKKLYQEI